MPEAIDALASWYAQHPPAKAFSGQTAAAVNDWRSEVTATLIQLSGLDRMAAWRCDFALTEGAVVDAGDHWRQRLELRTAPDYRMPFYVLKPKGDGPFTPILAIHGHGGGKDDVAGIAPDAQSAARIESHNYDYGRQAVRQGYIVFAPDKRGFGERGGLAKNCESLATSAFLMGLTVIGMHTWDNQRLLDYIGSRPDCRPGPVGCIGLSGGGGGTMWLAALDERISAAVISGHLGVYERGEFGCICNVVPHLLEVVDRGDLGALIAPRPLFVESASEDQCFSRERTLRGFAAAERVYAAAGVRDRLELELFDGRHEWRGKQVWPFLDRWLRG